MVTHEIFQLDHHALSHVYQGQLSAHPAWRHFPVCKNVVDELLRKVDDMIKANRRITIDGAAEELKIGHE
ncbi:hypothetical protein TNCV_711551 [Trichonephila clavipes]|nr:hypothetical protein TNCV_711551 [Trichonephila clavipes]